MSKLIFYCQCTYKDDFEDTLSCVEAAHKYVDYIIIIEDGSLDDEQRKKLLQYKNLILKTVEFKDNIPEFRNAYLEEAKKIASSLNMMDNAWIVVSDPDEHFNKELLKDLREIIDWAERNDYNMLGVNCREAFKAVEWLDDLDLLKECPGGYKESNFWKNLIFKLYPDLRYKGVGRRKRIKWVCDNCGYEEIIEDR